MKFTVIIAAYNSAEFIHVPLDSLSKQTFEDFDVLIIDDGSTDHTFDIVQTYRKLHPEWRYFKKKNGNWGSVMNFAVEHNLIRGDYVTILDSDDYFEKNTLYEMSVLTKDYDMLISGVGSYEKGMVKKMPVFFGGSRELKQKEVRTPISVPHGKFYKKEIFMQLPKLREGVPYQDTILFHSLVSKAKHIAYDKHPLVIWWRDRPGNSTTTVWDQKRVDMWFEICNDLLKINSTTEDDEIKAWIAMYLWEMKRHTKPLNITNKLKMNLKGSKFYWLPFGTRTLGKAYFYFHVKKFLIKKF